MRKFKSNMLTGARSSAIRLRFARDRCWRQRSVDCPAGGEFRERSDGLGTLGARLPGEEEGRPDRGPHSRTYRVKHSCSTNAIAVRQCYSLSRLCARPLTCALSRRVPCLCSYMWSEHQSMMQVSREAILDARVEFGPVPTWGKAEVQAAPDARKRRSERQERPKGTPCVAVGSWVHSAAVSPPPAFGVHTFEPFSDRVLRMRDYSCRGVERGHSGGRQVLLLVRASHNTCYTCRTVQ
jgi:hypothetical protein